MEKQQLEELIAFAKELYNTQHTTDEVHHRLSGKCSDHDLVHEIIKRAKKERHHEKTKKGMPKLIIGCVLLLLSFIIAYVKYHNNEPFEVIMYTFTTGGVTLLFWGLYDMLG